MSLMEKTVVKHRFDTPKVRALAESITKARDDAMTGYTYRAPEGFTELYNEITGQFRWVFLHEATGLVFKETHPGDSDYEPRAALPDATIHGVRYPVRIADYFIFEDIDYRGVTVQEYVDGPESCDCWEHRFEFPDGFDAHHGNWGFTNDGEIVVFDW